MRHIDTASKKKHHYILKADNSRKWKLGKENLFRRKVTLTLLAFIWIYFVHIRNNRHFQKPTFPLFFNSDIDKFKSRVPRYVGDHISYVPVWILSLEKEEIRRENIQRVMGVNAFEFVNGLDVSKAFPASDFEIIMGGPRLWRAKQDDLFAKMKLSVDYGHIKVLSKLIASEHEVAVILEDDAELVKPYESLQEEILKIFKKLPAIWDMVYLTEFGDFRLSNIDAAKGLKIVRSASRTLGYMIHKRGALKILSEIFSTKLHLNIDLLYSEMIKDGMLDAYLVIPGIIKRSNSAGNSTMDYDKARSFPLYRTMMSNFG